MPALLEFCAKGFHDARVFTDVPFVRAPGRPATVFRRVPLNALLSETRAAD